MHSSILHMYFMIFTDGPLGNHAHVTAVTGREWEFIDKNSFVAQLPPATVFHPCINFAGLNVMLNTPSNEHFDTVRGGYILHMPVIYIIL